MFKRNLCLGLSAVLLVLLAACSTASDEPAPPRPEAAKRYFTLTNGDSRFSFIYMGGLMVAPNCVTKPVTLLGDTADYIIFWAVDGSEIPDTVHINMAGQPTA